MSQRPGVQVTRNVKADGGVSPNEYIPAVSAHIRVYWPPRATDEQIIEALFGAFHDARTAIEKRREP